MFSALVVLHIPSILITSLIGAFYLAAPGGYVARSRALFRIEAHYKVIHLLSSSKYESC
jgi:hypothetical protein